MSHAKYQRACQGCAILRAAMPLSIPDPLDVWAAVVELGVEVTGEGPRDLVVIVGSLHADLPLVEAARGPFHLCALPRADVLAWAAGRPLREAVTACFGAPAPDDRAWTLAGVELPRFGLTVLAFNHDLATPSAASRSVMGLSLVPEDGGPAPGRLVTANGGVA